ncbi:hypothetical protein ZWY2020_051924 [Hordeum vulgare]|nr:hypothetical protein ZWY2020_051924 [Hordeum vulgare]
MQLERLPFCAIRPKKGNEGLVFANQPVTHTMILLLALLLICDGLGTAHCSAAPGNSTDMLQLLDFKRAITNDPRQALSSWNASVPIARRVIALNLAKRGLSGLIFPSSNLTFLETLDLSTNSFTGELPPLDNLHRLQHLLLSENSLKGIIPDTLANCSNLQTLDLSFNLLIVYPNYSLPKIISPNDPTKPENISQLEVINLADNQLMGSIPNEIGQFPDLTALLLGGNILSGRIPATLFNQSYLQILDVGINMIGNTLPCNFGDTLPSLTWLALTITSLTAISQLR